MPFSVSNSGIRGTLSRSLSRDATFIPAWKTSGYRFLR